MTPQEWMSRAMTLARRALGRTSPNPMVGAVVVRDGRLLGEGYHRRAGGPHAEIEALRAVRRNGRDPRGSTLYVTLEPCCTHGRTPPCTEAIAEAGIRQVYVAAVDPNPAHAGRGLRWLRRRGVHVVPGLLQEEATRLNEAFNHWIAHKTPWITVKTAMTLDGKIATASGESKWITGAPARRHAMRLRRQADAILVGVNTVIADDPSLTVRHGNGRPALPLLAHPLRIVLDSTARTPPDARVLTDEFATRTLIVVTRKAPESRLDRLRKRARVWVAPSRGPSQVSIPWLLSRLGGENVTHLLVEGGGEVNASFLLAGHAHRIAVYWAPKVLGGRYSLRGVAGAGASGPGGAKRLSAPEWARVGQDLYMTALIEAL